MGKTVDEWRRDNAPTEHILPSGLTAKIRRLTWKHVIQSGMVPLPLLSETVEATDNAASGGSGQKLIDPKASEEGRQLMDEVFMAAMVEPRVVCCPNKVTDGVLLLSEFDYHLPDKAYVFNVALARVNALRRFREEEE